MTRAGRGAPTREPIPWVTAVCVGAAVSLAAAPVSAIVQGVAFVGAVVPAAAVVVVAGLVLHRAGPVVAAVGQVVALTVLLTARYARDAPLGLLPGPSAFRDFGRLLGGARDQIDTTIAPVPSTPEILFLITMAFGVVTIVVYSAAVGAGAPAVGGVPLLATFAVPAALAADLLPWWTLAAAAAGFGLLLMARRGARRQIVGGVAVVTVAGLLALAVGTVTTFVGTANRFAEGGSSGSGTSEVGLSPFAALRGQLTQSSPADLLEVTGMPRPGYVRAVTLRDFVPESGWTVTSPDPGRPLPGDIPQDRAEDAGAEIGFVNLALRDYWLPLYGVPSSVAGLPDGRWAFDERNDIAYTARPRQDPSWTQRAVVDDPTLAELRASRGSGPGAEFLDVDGVDPRVGELTEQIVGGATTDVDRAVALQRFFTGPGSPFRYTLETAPGGGDDALVEFLTVGRQGFCEQYASAMAVMLRTAGVPSRVAIGFTAGRADGDTRVISTSDAHAWVEAWFPGAGWITFDPTPLADGRAITPPYVAEAFAEQGAGGAEPGQDEPPLAEGAEQVPPPEAAPPPAAEQPPDATDDSGQAGLPVWPFVVLLIVAGLVAMVVAPTWVRRRRRAHRLASVAEGGRDGAVAAWEEVLAESADRDVRAGPHDTVRATARLLIREHRLGGDAQQALRQLVGAVESSWYGAGPTAPRELDGPLQVVREAIAAGTPLTVRDRLLPRSVVHRGSLGVSDVTPEVEPVRSGT